MKNLKHIWNAVSLNRRMAWAGSFAVLLTLTVGNYFWVNSIAVNTGSKNNSNSGVQPGALSHTPPEGMVLVSGGRFIMGRNDTKNEAEKPIHIVSVTSFYIDIYETTNEQYAKFIKAINYRSPAGWTNSNYPTGQAKLPVVGVNWEDAREYAKWAGKRLPTEEEWEFAARGTDNYRYPWGNIWQEGKANANGASQTFTEVGKSIGKSPFGVYDMAGNAWEWTASDFKAYPGGKLPAVFSGKTNLKTIRGGSFEGTKDFVTTTYRLGWAATGATNYSSTGFRCAKDLGR